MIEWLSLRLLPVTEAAGKHLGHTWDETPAFVAFFTAFFLVSLAFWSLVARQPWHKAGLMASCIMSTVHGTVISIWGLRLLREWDWKAFNLDKPNSHQETLLVEFSFAYMITDFGYLMVFTPTDVMFIVHHIISSMFIIGVLHHDHSAIGCILMFWMGEITSPLLNVFTISRELRHSSKAAFRIFTLSSPLFTACYIVVRSILAPPIVLYFIYRFWFHSTAIPLLWRGPMGACVTLGIIGSQVWTLKLVRGFIRQRNKLRADKGAAKAKAQ